MLHVERKLAGSISVVRSGFSLMCLVYTLLQGVARHFVVLYCEAWDFAVSVFSGK